VGTTEERPAEGEEPPDGMDWYRKLYDYFAPARREADERGDSDEQINEWIDEALAAYRREQGG
jgi:hypothetical protein